MKKTPFLIILIALVFASGYFVLRPTEPTEATVAEPTPPFVVAPSLVSYGAQVGLTEAQLVEVKAQIGQGGCNLTFVACYDPGTDTVYISQKAFNTDYGPGPILAYEYGHHVWMTVLPETAKTNLRPVLVQLYGKLQTRPGFAAWFAPYLTYEGGTTSEAFYSEMYSAACTMTRDSEVPPELMTSCASFAPNRNALPSHF